jgi:hypothetical protein
MAVELDMIAHQLSRKLALQADLHPNRNAFEIDVDFEGESGIFCFYGVWDWKDREDRDKIKIRIQRAYVQYPDFELWFPAEYILKIEDWFNE